jgi:hypothetical protein
VYIYKFENCDSMEISLEDVRHRKYYARFQLLGNGSTTIALLSAGFYRGRLIHPEWMDLGAVRKWKTTCQRMHGAKCSAPLAASGLSSIKPTWVVDVWRQCLVRPTAGDDYVALSYVWGSSQFYTALRKHIDELQNPFSLSEGKTSTPIPNTIRHAMRLTERLGERYLWVDALCIVQDDESMKHADISNMSAIFANASLTIIAAQGENAESGLLGLPGISGPRSTQQTWFPWSNVAHVLRQDSPSLINFDTTWGKRAWTFQEELFSRKRLIFHENRVRWECPHATWNEESLAAHDIEARKSYMGYTRTMFSHVVPRLEELIRTLGRFNTRNLTYPEDALPAFAGIASALRQSFKGGFISGLPAAIFYIAILWQPKDILTRRKPRKPGAAVCLPSWSWAGWQGELHHSIWESALQQAWDAEITTPLVSWYYHRNRTEKGELIQNHWYEHEVKYLGDRHPHPCPAGWTRHQISGKSVCPPFKIRNFLPESVAASHVSFRHESEPESEFWYPVPLPDDEDCAAPPQQLAPFISCRTRRGWLLVGDPTNPVPSSTIVGVSLRDRTNPCVGFLQLHDRADTFGPELHSQPLQLVEVARGSRENNKGLIGLSSLPEWWHSEWLRRGLSPTYEYYHVMWIEWKGEVAYRKGLGRVEKGAWESQELEWIDLTLG